ncbi:GntR family transcriptional regulator [Chitinasiproducens palmae]|uniref:DNA-binding transcriptional regulator, GntR family n=1 Tax=Chitinasiproducens palmae TaxID=1770053 RepID=A0A1H2PMB1_9BURK|nr:GntR family transcriptional regulator [Chitinasiproducens palmae]SDV46858.1 DNA-binding transcriptional regulator, GntR family [Chitinasiproducens palmae]
MDTTRLMAPLEGMTGREPSGKMTDSAYLSMRRNILDNVWPAGHQATEAEIAASLEMSRTPVREALMRLQQEGLLRVMPRHGMRVLPVSPSDMAQIYQILTSLEATAAELVAARGLSAAQLGPLRAATDAMDGALREDDLTGWAAADEQFHACLLDLCGNAYLRDVVLNFWDRAHRARMVTLRLRPKPVHSTQEHIELVAALEAGDAVRAGRVQRAHRERAGAELLNLLKRLGLNVL